MRFAPGPVVLVMLWGCNQPSPQMYQTALQSGKNQIPVVANFERLFPDSEHRITGYMRDTPKWQSTVGLHGRYILTMELDVQLDDKRAKIVSWGTPRFLLLKVVKIEDLGGGQVRVKYDTDVEVNFGDGEWAKIEKANGDLSVLGQPLTTDDPLPQFEKAWRVR